MRSIFTFTAYSNELLSITLMTNWWCYFMNFKDFLFFISCRRKLSRQLSIRLSWQTTWCQSKLSTTLCTHPSSQPANQSTQIDQYTWQLLLSAIMSVKLSWNPFLHGKIPLLQYFFKFLFISFFYSYFAGTYPWRQKIWLIIYSGRTQTTDWVSQVSGQRSRVTLVVVTHGSFQVGARFVTVSIVTSVNVPSIILDYDSKLTDSQLIVVIGGEIDFILIWRTTVNVHL